jgi:hypothetical protein
MQVKLVESIMITEFMFMKPLLMKMNPKKFSLLFAHCAVTEQEFHDKEPRENF